MLARPLNATAGALLGLLHDGPMTGWDLVAAAQQRIGNFWTLTQSQVYRELATMAQAGLVELGPPGPRDSKPYEITDTGRAAFAEWIDQEPGPDQVRSRLLLTIAFAGHLAPERLAEMVSAQRAVHAERLAGYERIRADLAGRPGDNDYAADRSAPAPKRSRAHQVEPEVSGAADRSRLATLEFGLRYERAVLDWLDWLDWLDAAPTMLGLTRERRGRSRAPGSTTEATRR